MGTDVKETPIKEMDLDQVTEELTATEALVSDGSLPAAALRPLRRSLEALQARRDALVKNAAKLLDEFVKESRLELGKEIARLEGYKADEYTVAIAPVAEWQAKIDKAAAKAGEVDPILTKIMDVLPTVGITPPAGKVLRWGNAPTGAIKAPSVALTAKHADKVKAMIEEAAKAASMDPASIGEYRVLVTHWREKVERTGGKGLRYVIESVDADKLAQAIKEGHSAINLRQRVKVAKYQTASIGREPAKGSDLVDRFLQTADGIGVYTAVNRAGKQAGQAGQMSAPELLTKMHDAGLIVLKVIAPNGNAPEAAPPATPPVPAQLANTGEAEPTAASKAAKAAKAEAAKV